MVISGAHGKTRYSTNIHNFIIGTPVPVNIFEVCNVHS